MITALLSSTKQRATSLQQPATRVQQRQGEVAAARRAIMFKHRLSIKLRVYVRNLFHAKMCAGTYSSSFESFERKKKRISQHIKRLEAVNS